MNSRRAQAHAKHAHICRCGKKVMGNGYYSHRNRCRVYLEYRALRLKNGSVIEMAGPPSEPLKGTTTAFLWADPA